ncbi:MAG: hypothetical protein CBC62_07335 [Opitutia bacterium TMED102]|nr:MAG: hypothetical protein CBC62_07335 [Opitutae bacterium TMED102]
MFGIVVADSWEYPFWPVLFSIFVLAAIGLFVQKARLVALGVLLFAFGFANQSFQLRFIPETDLRNFVAEDPQIVSLTGRLATTPEHRVSKIDAKERWRSTVELAVSEIEIDDATQNVTGKVLVSASRRLAGSYYVGRRVRVSGVLSRPLIEHAEGMFPYREYLSRHNVHFQLRTKSARDWRMLDEAVPPSMPYSVRFQRWAREALAKSLGEEDDSVRLL